MSKLAIWMVVLALLSLGIFLSGCQSLTSSPEQEIQKYRRIADLNNRMWTEDVDVFLLFDRPSYLSRWYIPRD